MKLYKSNGPNTFHYVTLVRYKRVPVFRSDKACEIFVDALRETRERFPYKLIGYVIMPDHVQAIVNNRSDTISDWLRRVRGNSARQILAWLREGRHLMFAQETCFGASTETTTHTCGLAKGSVRNRSLESQIRSPKIELPAFESRASGFVRTSGQMEMVELSRIFAA